MEKKTRMACFTLFYQNVECGYSKGDKKQFQGDLVLHVQVDERKGYLDTSYMVDKKGI